MKAIVLAAGRSSRFWPLAQEGHKSAYCVAYGKPVIQYTLDSLVSMGIKEVAVVRAPVDPPLAKCLMNYQAQNGLKISSFCQAGATGTGDAILAAEEFLGDLRDDQHFLVLNASQINIKEIMIELYHEPYSDNLPRLGKTLFLFGQKTERPENFGVMRVGDDGKVLEVREKPRSFISPIRVVGVYLLNKAFLRELMNRSGEYSLEETLQFMVGRGKDLRAVVLLPEMPLFSLKYPWDLLAFNRFLMGKNMPTVNIISTPQWIRKGVQLVGNGIVIRTGATIYENAIVKGPCFIDEGAVIGDHATVRECSYVGKYVVVGSHSEGRNSILYDGVRLHRNFVGDSILDEGCSLGAGTITANKRIDRKNVKTRVDGKRIDSGLRRLGVVMGSRVKVGINMSLMPGVMVGRGTEIIPREVVDQSYVDKLNVKDAE